MIILDNKRFAAYTESIEERVIRSCQGIHEAELAIDEALVEGYNTVFITEGFFSNMWEKIRRFLETVWNHIKSIWNKLINWIKNIVKRHKAIDKALVDEAMENAQKGTDRMSRFVNGIRKIFKHVDSKELAELEKGLKTYREYKEKLKKIAKYAKVIALVGGTSAISALIYKGIQACKKDVQKSTDKAQRIVSTTPKTQPIKDEKKVNSVQPEHSNQPNHPTQSDHTSQSDQSNHSTQSTQPDQSDNSTQSDHTTQPDQPKEDQAVRDKAKRQLNRKFKREDERDEDLNSNYAFGKFNKAQINSLGDQMQTETNMADDFSTVVQFVQALSKTVIDSNKQIQAINPDEGRINFLKIGQILKSADDNKDEAIKICEDGLKQTTMIYEYLRQSIDKMANANSKVNIAGEEVEYKKAIKTYKNTIEITKDISMMFTMLLIALGKTKSEINQLQAIAVQELNGSSNQKEESE